MFLLSLQQARQQHQCLDERYHPDIIFAEAVGSCTDLIATVALPLIKYKQIPVVVSVFVDAEFLQSMLNNTTQFSENIHYIYNKQIEEADLVIINKKDRLTSEQITLMNQILKAKYPSRIFLFQNSLDEKDIEEWLDIVENFPEKSRNPLNMDYEQYAKGEAELAWLDQTLIISTHYENAVSRSGQIIGKIFDRIQEQRLPIGHLKFMLENSHGHEKISFTTMSTSSTVRLKLKDSNLVSMMINARVQSSPETLISVIDSVIAEVNRNSDMTIECKDRSAFVPGYPRPTYRFSE
jgi:G3E family GTPase